MVRRPGRTPHGAKPPPRGPDGGSTRPFIASMFWLYTDVPFGWLEAKTKIIGPWSGSAASTGVAAVQL
jgi:hypothetical protein